MFVAVLGLTSEPSWCLSQLWAAWASAGWETLSKPVQCGVILRISLLKLTRV